MKFNHNRQYTTVATYALIVIIVAMIFNHAMQGINTVFNFIWTVCGYLMPVIYGIVFAFLLNSLLRQVEGRLFNRFWGDKLRPSTIRIFSVLATYIIFFVCVAAFVAIVLPQLISSLMSLLGNIPKYLVTLTTFYNDFTRWLNDFLASSAGSETAVFANEFSSTVTSTLSNLMRTMYQLLEQSITALVSITTSVTTGVLNLILGIIVSIYILMDREKLFAQSKKMARAIFTHNAYDLLYDITMDISRIFSGFVIGKVIDSLIIGVICLVGMNIFQFPYPMLISVIVCVTNVIPYFGPFIGAIPSAIIIFIISPVQAVWFCVFILLLQQLDGNVIGPKILGDTIGLSPLWIIFSIMLFSGLLGILGMFIGVPLFAILYSLVRRLVNFLLRRKGEPTDTKAYASEDNPLVK